VNGSTPAAREADLTILVAPMTTKGRVYPTRVACRFKSKAGLVVLDQIRTIDKIRCVKKVGYIDRRTAGTVLSILSEMFAG